MLRFSDGITIDTSGPLRTLHLHDGWYVVGKGMLIPVGSEQKALDQIESMGEFESSIPMTESSKEEKGDVMLPPDPETGKVPDFVHPDHLDFRTL